MTLSRKINLIPVLLSVFVLVSLVFPSKFNAVSIYLFCGYALFDMIRNKTFKWKNEFVLLTALFFFLHVFHCFSDSNVVRAIFEVEKKLAFLLLPFFWCNLIIQDRKLYAQKVLMWFVYAITAFGFFLIINAGINYFNSGDSSVFFYHSFVSIIEGSAIYFSLMYSISLLIIFEKLCVKKSNSLILLLAINSLIIIFLSSKTFVVALLFLYVFYFIKIRHIRFSIIIFGVFIFASQFFVGNETVSKRFSDLNLSNFFSLKEQIDETTTFDGFTLRKELWNMGVSLNQEDSRAFFFGKGPGDTQDALNIKIKEKGLFTGKTGTDNTGFLNYNFHNQYIQTLVELGLVGLSILFLIFYYLFYLGKKFNNRLIIFINLLFLIGFITESFLSRQIGIISFIGFNSLLVFSLEENTFKSSIKRVFDIIFSLFVIVFFLSWLFPLLCLFIYLDTKSIPIFVQNRVGQNTKTFRCFKLRTMLKNKEANHLPAQENDVRITPLGHFLRKYAIDELPQFFNVLFGSMSIVGPRPLMIQEENELNKKFPGFSSRLVIKPGLTGLAQANGYKGIIEHDADLKIRFRLDKLYKNKQSLWLDIKIIIRTVTYLLK